MASMIKSYGAAKTPLDARHHRSCRWVNAEGGVDIQAAPGGCLHLQLAHGGVQGVELAVDIGGTNGIPVHKGQLPTPERARASAA